MFHIWAVRTRAALGLRLVKGRSPSLTKFRRNAKLKFATQNCVVEGAQRRGRLLNAHLPGRVESIFFLNKPNKYHN